MSLLVITAAAAVLATPAQPVHAVETVHRGDTYRITYRSHVETRLQTIGMSAGSRPSAQRCVVSAHVSVERGIAPSRGGQELKTVLPDRKSFSQHLPGDCRGRSGEADKLLARKAEALSAHLGRVAVADKPAALATIDSAHHFAAN